MEYAEQECHSPKMIEIEEMTKVMLKQRSELEITLKDINDKLSNLKLKHIEACGDMGHDLHTEREQERRDAMRAQVAVVEMVRFAHGNQEADRLLNIGQMATLVTRLSRVWCHCSEYLCVCGLLCTINIFKGRRYTVVAY